MENVYFDKKFNKVESFHLTFQIFTNISVFWCILYFYILPGPGSLHSVPQITPSDNKNLLINVLFRNVYDSKYKDVG